jgi:hypothetical protein
MRALGKVRHANAVTSLSRTAVWSSRATQGCGTNDLADFLKCPDHVTAGDVERCLVTAGPSVDESVAIFLGR